MHSNAANESNLMQSHEAPTFNFDAPAEVFPSRGKRGRSLVQYRRFETTAEAVRFTIEELPSALLGGTYLQVQDERFDSDEIRSLYERADFPLQRQTKAVSEG
jgi:hypothetical protein